MTNFATDLLEPKPCIFCNKKTILTLAIHSGGSITLVPCCFECHQKK